MHVFKFNCKLTVVFWQIAKMLPGVFFLFLLHKYIWSDFAMFYTCLREDYCVESECRVQTSGHMDWQMGDSYSVSVESYTVASILLQ